jgi:hypothetical protein
MKAFYLGLFLFTASQALASTGVIGEVHSQKECSKEVMVWLSLDKENYKERLLLMHTLVPVGGKFQFYLKPGNYQVRASDEEGCEFFQRVKVTTSHSLIDVKMVKK